MNKLGKYTSKAKLAIFGAVAAVTTTAAQAQYDFVAQDGTTGEISFDPGSLVAPIVTAIIAAIAASAAIFVLFMGVRMLFRVIKGSK